MLKSPNLRPNDDIATHLAGLAGPAFAEATTRSSRTEQYLQAQHEQHANAWDDKSTE